MPAQSKILGAEVRSLMIEPPAFPKEFAEGVDGESVENLELTQDFTKEFIGTVKRHPLPAVGAAVIVGISSALWFRGLAQLAVVVVAKEFAPELEAVKEAGKKAVMTYVSRRLRAASDTLLA